jgi:hypothetical protein
MPDGKLPKDVKDRKGGPITATRLRSRIQGVAEPRGRFGYVIHTKKIPPMGNITCAAKVTLMVDRHRNCHVPADQFGKTWGKTVTKARDKMQAKVEHWIAAKVCEK